MQLYHQSLLESTAATKALKGHFTEFRVFDDARWDILLVKSSSLDLYQIRQNEQSVPKLSLTCSYKCFETICDVVSFTSSSTDTQLGKDLLIVALNNGKLLCLEFNDQIHNFIVKSVVQVYPKANPSFMLKPIVPYYLSVNQNSALLMVSSIQLQAKIYEIVVDHHLMLQEVFSEEKNQSKDEICFGIISGNHNQNAIFRTLTKRQNQQKQCFLTTYKFKLNQISIERELIHASNYLLGNICDSFFLISPTEIVLIDNQSVKTTIKAQTTNKAKTKPRELLFCTCCQIPEGVLLVTHEGSCLMLKSNNLQKIGSVLGGIICLLHISSNIFFGVCESRNHCLFRLNGEDEQAEVLAEVQHLGLLNDMKIPVEPSTNGDIYLASGKQGKGYITVLKHGIKITELKAISYPTSPTNIWCLKRKQKDHSHSYIIIALQRKTAILKLQQNSLASVNQILLQEYQPTLHVDTLQDGSIVQVLPFKIRHIQGKSITEIQVKQRILAGTSVKGGHQVAISMSGAFLALYQLDTNGALEKRQELTLENEIILLEFSPPVQNHSSLLFIAKYNFTISVYRLTQQASLISTKHLKSSIESLAAIQISSKNQQNTILLNAAMATGILIQLKISQDGSIIDMKQEKISQKGFKLMKINIFGRQALMRMAPQSSLAYIWKDQFTVSNLPLSAVEVGSQILVGQAQPSIITHFEGYLRIITFSSFGQIFHREIMEVEMPAKKLLLFEKYLGVLEYDKIEAKSTLMIEEMSEKVQQRMQWVSQFEIYNLKDSLKKTKVIYFDQNQKCLSACFKASEDSSSYLLFGCATDLHYQPSLSSVNQCIKVYSWNGNQSKISFLYSFPVDSEPNVLQNYKNKILAGIGNSLTLFQIGKLKLLVKAQKNHFQSKINNICCEGDKIFITEVLDSFSLFKRNVEMKTFNLIADDILPRYSVSAFLLDGDYGVMAGSDKFGNFFISKLSQKINQLFYSTQLPMPEIPLSKFQLLANFNCGEIITSIQIGKLDVNKSQVIVYSTVDGRVGVFCPFESEFACDQQILQQLQGQMIKSDSFNLKNNEEFRSRYHPMKGVIDGDCCQYFNLMGFKEQTYIASKIGSTVQKCSQAIEAVQKNYL